MLTCLLSAESLCFRRVVSVLFTFLQPLVLVWKEKQSCPLTGNYFVVHHVESWISLAAAGTVQKVVESVLSECTRLIWIYPEFSFLTGFSIL